MPTDGPGFYDQAAVFDTYQTHRGTPESPNQTLERPVIQDLMGDVRGCDCLDLGCGDAGFGLELLAAGARSYLGIDGSWRMVERARSRLAGTAGQVLQADVATWHGPLEQFDRVSARLMLHYLPDLAPVLAGVRAALRAGGRFVLSVEHPVITSCDRAWNGEGLRQSWIVDDYFRAGAREVRWMGSSVTKYHRTVEQYYAALTGHGFVVEALRESEPVRTHFHTDADFERRQRIPLFLFLAARKP